MNKSRWILGGLVVLAVAGAGVLAWYRWGRPPAAPTLSLTQERMLRRAFDGAPPVIPHPPLGGACISCHTGSGRDVPGVGVAPPNPHLETMGMSEQSRCLQCHVFRQSEEVWVASEFRGLRPVSQGSRLYAHGPPVIPHPTFMRESCLSCHDGLAGRPDIRCTHPERDRCLQCHAQTIPPAAF